MDDIDVPVDKLNTFVDQDHAIRSSFHELMLGSSLPLISCSRNFKLPESMEVSRKCNGRLH